MRRLSIIITTVTLLCSVCTLSFAASVKDLKVIKKRLQNSFAVGFPSAPDVEGLLNDLTATGQFASVEYDSHEFNSGGDKRKHLLNITKLAKAYQNQSGAHFKSKQVYDAIEKSLKYWVDANLEDENWWHRIIGFPKDMMTPLLLISDDLKRFNRPLFDKCIEYELYSWAQPKQRAQEGANGTDICKFTFTTAIIKEDVALLGEVIDKVNSLVKIATGPKEEGIQADYSFSQHTGNGRQLYLATYGREYIDGLLYFMEYINGTDLQFSPEKIDIIEQLFLEGVAWAWYQNEMDPSQCGRKIVDENTGPSFVTLTRRLNSLGTPRKEQLSQMLNMMSGKSELTGNKMYWRHDYMIHRGEGYMTTARMTSTRTVGNEAGNGQGFDNYHTGDGANYIKVKGNEYSPIYASWNWKRIPGTTVMADARVMPKPMWGAEGEGHNDYASGVSDTKNGVSAFIYDKDSLQAHKSWFFFDRYFVALGAGISTVRTDAPAVTTVNQTTLSGDVLYSDGTGAAQKLGAQSQPIGMLWHNDVGYRFENGTAPFTAQIQVNKGSKNILWLACDHGTAPTGSTYAYGVYPNTGKEFMSKAQNEYTILSNTPEVQAVEDKATGKIMAAFYSPATLNGAAIGDISVDKPTILIIEPKGDKIKISVANPFCESRNQDKVSVKIGAKSQTIEFKDEGNSVEI